MDEKKCTFKDKLIDFLKQCHRKQGSAPTNTQGVQGVNKLGTETLVICRKRKERLGVQ